MEEEDTRQRGNRMSGRNRGGPRLGRVLLDILKILGSVLR